MVVKNTRSLRRAALAALAGGLLLQAGSCSAGSVLSLVVEIATKEGANLLSDTIFFFLDNLFVRLTG